MQLLSFVRFSTFNQSNKKMNSINRINSSLNCIFQKPLPSTVTEVSHRFKNHVIPQLQEYDNKVQKLFFSTFLKTVSKNHLRVNEEMFDGEEGAFVAIELSLMWAFGLLDAVAAANVVTGGVEQLQEKSLQECISDTLTRLFQFASLKTGCILERSFMMSTGRDNDVSSSASSFVKKLVKKLGTEIWMKHCSANNQQQKQLVFDALFIDVFDQKIAKMLAEKLISADDVDDNQSACRRVAEEFVEAALMIVNENGEFFDEKQSQLENLNLLKEFLLEK